MKNFIGKYGTRLAVFCVIIAVVVLAGCTTAHAAPPAKAHVGFSNGGDFDWEASSALTRDFTDMASIGSSWVRLDAGWNAVQAYGPDYWNWSNTDRIVGAALTAHQHVLLQLTYSPPWARRSECAGTLQCAPKNPSDFARFASAVVHRYGPLGVKHFEIWNEPNLQQWWGDPPNAADYTNLLKPAYVAIHAVDPTAMVITGGTAPNGDLGANPTNPSHPVNWLKALYAAGAQGYFDAVGHHPYPMAGHAPDDCCVNWNAFMETPWLHDIMASHGDGAKQVWGTEFGIPTMSAGDQQATYQQQSDWLASALGYWGSWTNAGETGPLFVMELRDAGTDPAVRDDNLGLETITGTHKPAYERLRAILVGS